MLILENITKRYEQRIVLDQVSLTALPAQTTVLIGPSGCGKSSLLRVIVGLVVPDIGNVRIRETSLTPQTVNQLRRQMGYVIQEGGLFPHLTARENISLMPRVLGWAQAQIIERITALTQLTHLPEDSLDRYPTQLSGGQKQRVSLMRALMLDPPLLLLDEPLGALDPMIRRELQEELKEIFHRLKKTVIFVTHDLSEAAFFADSMVLMREGRIIQQGLLSDLTLKPREPFVTRFVNAQRSLMEPIRS